MFDQTIGPAVKSVWYAQKVSVAVVMPGVHCVCAASKQLSIPCSVKRKYWTARLGGVQPGFAAMACCTSALRSAFRSGLATVPLPPYEVVLSINDPPNVTTFWVAAPPVWVYWVKVL